MKWRILLLSLGIMLVCMLTFAFAGARVYYQSSIDDSQRFLRVYMNGFDAQKYSNDAAGARAFSDALGGARVTFMDFSGTVTADSSADGITENHKNRSEIINALLSGEGFAVRDSSTLGKNMVYYCKSFADDGRLVRIAVFTDSDWNLFWRTLGIIAQFFAVIVVLCAILAFVSTHFILGPVKTLAAGAAACSSVSAKYSELKPVADLLNERNRNIERQMSELNAEKENVERARQSKDEFISNVTHEMNTPLTSIRGYSELLAAGGMNDEQKSVAYQTILAQSERLTNLIACIINYSKIDSDELASYEVDFSALARETIQALQPEAAARDITIAHEIDDNVIIRSRHERLSEIFGNLVRNAIKYNKDGGSIIVRLDRQRLSVEDTGIGIAPENIDKVFSRFFTVDKSHGGKNGGFGLGLAVAKKICQKSGWKIGVESTLGEGSRFTVEF